MPTFRRAGAYAFALVTALGLFVPASAQPVPESDGIARVLAEIEKGLLEGNPDRFLALVTPGASIEAASEFARPLFVPGITNVTIKERDRLPLSGTVAGEGYRLLVEALLERGRAGRIVTWRLDVRRARDEETRWFISAQEQVSSLDGLHQLQLDENRPFAARDLTITSIDYSIHLPKGHVFVAETGAGVTALVLAGKGTMRFSPAPAAERRQVRIFAGSETLEASFDLALVRINPAEYADRVSSGALTADPEIPREVRDAREFFNAQIGLSFTIATDLSPRSDWSLTPGYGDFLADVRTRKHGTLTFARSLGEAEDVTLFDRRRRRNISLYPSPQKLEARGRFYNEDDLADYDVQTYDVEATFDPGREWLEGRTTLAVKVRAPSMGTLTFKLAETLNVQSIVSQQLGRLLFFRVVGQNSVIISLPSMVFRDQQLSLTVTYAGRLPPQVLDREAIAVAADLTQDFVSDFPIAQAEPRFIYSNRAYWYPQAPVTDYATARLKITVPENLACVASGVLADMRVIKSADRGDSGRREYTYEARQPLRYLACVISRFVGPHTLNVKLTTPSADSSGTTVRHGAPAAVSDGVLRLDMSANPRQEARGKNFQERAASMFQFFSALAGDTPYPSFTLAVTESELPGGHSPAYFAVLSQPPVQSTLSWRNDPVNFDGYPSFFLAHEIAHQWWGQAVGWKNYHEQWISEGFAQYFAAMYAMEERGPDTYISVLRQMRRWAVAHSDQGPISLGYRLGHIRGDSRAFRAVVYNKSAIVLDMLRRLVGDTAFFRGLRRFYFESRFKKAGTDDVRKAFEAESGEELDRFFDGWIFSSDLPAISVQRQIVTGGNGGPSLRLVFEQQQPELFDVVIPVDIRYLSNDADRHEIRVRERRTEVTVPLKGQLKSVEPDPDRVTLASFR
jgi:hypothetical protein